MIGDIKFRVSLEDGVSPSAQKAAASIGNLNHELNQNRLESDDAFAGLGPLGVGIAAVGAASLAAGVALATGIVHGLESLVETALDVTNVNRRLAASFEALGGSGAGQKTLDFVDQLARKLPQSRAQIAGWVSQFQALGITDLGQIKQQVLATASAQAITFAQGGQGAEVYTKLAERIHVAVEEHKGLKLAEKTLKQLYAAGLNLTDVAAAYGKQTGRAALSAQQLGAELKAGTVDAQAFGNALSTTLVEKGRKPLQAMGDDLKTIGAKGLETFEHFFDDIDTSPLTDAFKSVVSLGDQGEPSGQALKKGISGALNEIIRWIAEGITQAELFFLDLEIGALKSGIGLKDLRVVLTTISDDLATAAKWAGTLFDAMSRLATIEVRGEDLAKSLVTGDLKGALGAGADVAHAVAPANAAGGVVQRPATGEIFASVAPGELIIPRRQSEQLTRGDVANDNGGASGGGGVTIEHLELHIDAPHGVTDATQVSASGLSLALERFAIGSGR